VVVLKENWGNYDTVLSVKIKSKISNIKVPCTWEFSSKTRLTNTYLPLKPLKKVCRNFSVLESFPFLKVPASTRDDTVKDWEFLTSFGVGNRLDLDFYLEILRCFLNFSNEKLVHVDPKSIYSLYQDIQHQCWQAEEGQDYASAVR
jgi:hypothetical protein